jgi:hypothetical protein
MSENGNTISNADKKKLKLLMGASTGTVAGMGKAIVDKNIDKIGELIGSLSKKSKTPSPIPMPDEIKRRRPKMSNKEGPSPIPMPDEIKKARKSNRDFSDNPVMQTRKSNEGMKEGGKVKGYQNGGCIMAGRGGKFKGIS